MEAINYASDCQIDVVMIDTAGRMQDNEPLMRALAKVWTDKNVIQMEDNFNDSIYSIQTNS